MNRRRKVDYEIMEDSDMRQMPARPAPPMPRRPQSPFYMYPPSTVYNPVGVPPGSIEVPGAYIPDSVQAPGRIVQPSPYDRPGGIGQPPVRVTPTEPPVDFEPEQGPPVRTDPAYIQGYLVENIGRYVKAEFVIGTNLFIDREGTLVDVGVDHFVLQEPETDDLTLCDLYSVKFVKFFY